MGIQNISANQFSKLAVDQFILDVRTKDEFDEGHIKDAVLIPFDELSDNTHYLPTDKSKPIFVYCHLGGRSMHGCLTLSKMGYSTIYNLDGGINSWIYSGLNLVR